MSTPLEFVRIEPGCFQMGQAEGGDRDERPVHEVTLSKSFSISEAPVTNAQYEAFDPAHCALRGKGGFSTGDDEAVVFVSWHDAVRFCRWLSKKQNKPCRLPTEAEWEYACRAGTTTLYHTGDTLPEIFHRNQQTVAHPVPVSLKVKVTPPNAWGLYDMHGLVEEWCQDWYGPYEAFPQKDPLGRESGLFKVTRGGSHNTPVPYLRSANRLGTLPEDKHWLIGFRVVMGEQPRTAPIPAPAPPLWAKKVSQKTYDWPANAPDPSKPFFSGPIPFVRIPKNPETIPFYPHNHCPSITWCPNGDLLAVWFSTVSEKGREMTILASRLRAGNTRWDMPSEFFKAPDRNMTGSALFHDGKGKIYHFNGLEAAGTWANLALVMRTSTDNGVTWQTKLINADHGPRNQVISGTFQTKERYLVQPCDADATSDSGTVLHTSRDGGRTWSDPRGVIAGIHAGVTQLKDGRLLAFGRWGRQIGIEKNGKMRMPMSVSRDMGKTWKYGPSDFPPIAGGQRPILMRVAEGHLFFASFTDSAGNIKNGNPQGLTIPDASGKAQTVYGLFAALSFDEGKTWPVKKLISDNGPGRKFNGQAWTGSFTMDYNHAEPKGYLAATQTPDGVIHLISSALHYRFHLKWLTGPMPPTARPPALTQSH